MVQISIMLSLGLLSLLATSSAVPLDNPQFPGITRRDSNISADDSIAPPARRGRSCDTEGEMICDGQGFLTCDHNRFVFRACAPGTFCRPHDHSILCDFRDERD
ncbi:hypothetical protein C8R44DRAFT_885560 [Mycena epipterygia]|nr:hypothetical protein C8R44DRAFT_885560 [Mycena epipterygia]